METILLHHCCGPCSPAVLDFLKERFTVAGFWCNPNIHPRDEYEKRRDSLMRLASSRGVTVHSGEEISESEWLKQAPATVPERCAWCYRIRLAEAARAARRLGIRYFTTTLLVSPYQKHELVRREGAEAAAGAPGSEFWYRDFRPLFYAGKDQARREGLYLQKYCGCSFSIAEKAAAAAARREKAEVPRKEP